MTDYLANKGKDMASIRKRVTKNGRVRYVAEIRLKSKGRIVHQESKTFSRRVLAVRWAENKEAHIKVNGIPKKYDRMTIAELIDKYVHDYKDNVRMGRSKAMDLNALSLTGIALIETQDLNSGIYIDHVKKRLATGVKPQTANNDIVWIGVILKFGMAVFNIEADLSQLDVAKMFLKSSGMIARSARRDRIPNVNEHKRLVDYFNNRRECSNVPMADILLFAMYSARRQSEITRIMWADNKNMTGLVRDAKHPRIKIGNNRRFNYTKEGFDIVLRQPTNDARIFPYSSRTISAYFTDACKILEIHDLRFHDYRHLATSWLFTQGLAIQEVSCITLHESWNMLKRYTHISHDEKQVIHRIYKEKN